MNNWQAEMYISSRRSRFDTHSGSTTVGDRDGYERARAYISAFCSTGSDLCLIRKNPHVRINPPAMDCPSHTSCFDVCMHESPLPLHRRLVALIINYENEYIVFASTNRWEIKFEQHAMLRMQAEITSSIDRLSQLLVMKIFFDHWFFLYFSRLYTYARCVSKKLFEIRETSKWKHREINYLLQSMQMQTTKCIRETHLINLIC